MPFTRDPIKGDTTVKESLILKYWSKEVWEAGIDESYLKRFMGRDSNSIVHIKTELSKGAGDSINIPLRLPLNGAGVINDDWLEGNEEKLTYADFNVGIAQIRNGVRLEGRYEEQKTQINMRRDAKAALKDWLAKWIDCSGLAVLTGTKPPFVKDDTTDKFPFPIEPPSTDRTLYAMERTSEQGLQAGDVFSTKLIGEAKRLAIADEETAIRPVKINGAEHYIMLIDHYQARDLRRDELWIEAQKHANIRGESNPIFTGAMGMFENVIIHENGRVPRTPSGQGATAVAGSKYNEYKDGVMVGHALLLGAQALTFAEGKAPTTDVEYFDYKNKTGFSIARMCGMKRSRFQYNGTDWTDYGCINVLTSSVPDRKAS